MDLLKQCSVCKQFKSTKLFSKHRSTRTGFRSQCKACIKLGKQLNTEKMLVQRAKQYGIACTLTAADITIPSTCPLLNIPLTHSSGSLPVDGSPSLDRIDSSLGYTPENTWVISHRANTIKTTATLHELKLLTLNLERLQHGRDDKTV